MDIPNISYNVHKEGSSGAGAESVSQTQQLVGSISTQEKNIYFYFLCSGVEAKYGVEFRHSTSKG